MTDLTDIIARLEKATGPDRELDGLIERHGCTQPYKTVNTPYYTASLDAALTLAAALPDDFGVGVLRSSYPLNIPDTGPRWNAEIWNIRERTAKDYQQNLAKMKIYSGKHVNPAIALCIAICKARDATP